MITANLAGSSLQPSHLRGEREKFKSHSRLNLNEDNSDSASNKQNPEDWNPNDTNSDHGQIISEHLVPWLYITSDLWLLAFVQDPSHCNSANRRTVFMNIFSVVILYNHC